MKSVECRTQTECDAALAAQNLPVLVGDGWFEITGTQCVEASGSSHVVASGSSRVVAWEHSHVVAFGSSYIVAFGSSHVVARESSHVVARESSYIEAWGSSDIEASPEVAVHQHSSSSHVNGGVVIVVKAPRTPAKSREIWELYS